MSPLSTRDQDRMQMNDDRMLGLIDRGFQQRAEDVSAERRARLGADLGLRNQTLINEQREEEQIRAERRELAEIQRQKAEWSFGDKTTDFLIKAGDYPRINEKMAQDSQFANEFSTIMKDDSLDWGQKTRAIYAAEAAASQRIAVRQKAIPFVDTLMGNQHTITLPSGEQINVIRDPETRKLYTTHLKRDESETSPWESEPQGQTQEQPQQEEMAEMYPGGPLIPMSTPYPGAPVPVAPQQQAPNLPRWKPGAQINMALKIQGESKASGVPMTLPDAQIMAEAERYKEASIPFPPQFAKMYDAAYDRQQRAWEASIGKMAGGGKEETRDYPVSFEDDYTDAEIKEAFATVNKQATEYVDKEGKVVPMPQEDYWKAVRDRLNQNRRAVVIGNREKQRKGEGNVPSQPFQNEQPGWVWPYGGGGQSPTASPGPPPTPPRGRPTAEYEAARAAYDANPTQENYQRQMKAYKTLTGGM